MIWYGIFISGILNFFTKFLSLSFFDAIKISPKVKQLLIYVPSAVFPAIIFPGILLDINGSFDLENNPKILASIIAIITAIISKNIVSTIFAGLAVYWLIIFI
ncbi:MAG: AzlD domain-containing protein [Pelagibacteraceae bacterium]|nr:AzlD domain-containing protein [Pelagibacteraceae bacterium]PHX89363.1 MAG: branched-chain amino acid transporter [Pelagibacteraceae bacterium]